MSNTTSNIHINMKVSFKIRAGRCKDGLRTGRLYLRVRQHTSNSDIVIATGIEVVTEYWDSKIMGYKPNTPPSVISNDERKQHNETLQQLALCIEENCSDDSSKEAIEQVAKMFFDTLGENKPTGYTKSDRTREVVKTVTRKVQPKKAAHFYVLDYFAMYLKNNQFNSWHNQALTTVMHKLERYEAFQGFLAELEDFHLELSDFNREEMERYHEYLCHESEYRDAYPDFYSQFKLAKSIDIRKLSKNAVSISIQRLNMFLNWCVREGYLKDTDFRLFKPEKQVYGVPYYLTIEERNSLMNFDLSEFPRLELHRDKFVFQCLIGCRCDDLDRLTWDNINGDFLEYIPHKNLLNDHAETVRFPLTDNMRIILERQNPECNNLFFPYCQEIYRVDIKEILKRAGIERMVTILDPQTRRGVQKPICEVAASHLARRTFIANLYNKVKDPNLISSLTGHVNDSKAFARYRVISDDAKKELIDMIDD